MREIQKNGKVLARHILPSDIKNGLNFFSKDGEFIQVGVWGNYEKGKHLQEHIHKEFSRNASRTHEMLYVISGSIEASIYDLEENTIDHIVVHSGEILLLLDSGHGYTILEDGTTVLEAKNGPYAGAEKDRYRF